MKMLRDIILLLQSPSPLDLDGLSIPAAQEREALIDKVLEVLDDNVDYLSDGYGYYSRRPDQREVAAKIVDAILLAL